MASSGLSRQRSTSDRRRGPMPPPVSKGKEIETGQPFIPAAATASTLLFAQGNEVLCLDHDSLAVQRRFHKHKDPVQLIAVDNVSEAGTGRLVVTYDVGRTSIIWDIFTGEQISRFASYEPLTVAAWMRNGNIAFGNEKGEIILFEPSTSEHVSARSIYDKVTALAPSSDCKTYAIGYNNGSLLLAALQPSFTILHTLTTSRAPSPITHLSWHASSSKQKSDMLASQTADADCRIWSVAKPPIAEPPRVIRVLRRPDPDFLPGRTWIAWSKNGRIVQYSESETWSWDVRTKHVTYENIPVIDGVRGIAAYGPTAALFTMGPDYTVQQYDMEDRKMSINVRHLPITIPPTPPVDEKSINWTASGSEEDLTSPVVRHRQDHRVLEQARHERISMRSPQSQLSGTTHSATRSNNVRQKELISPGQQTEMTGTTFMSGSTSYTGLAKENHGLVAASPQSTRSARKGSRLKQEVVMSPQEPLVDDLFPFIRSRLSDVPYRPPRSIDETRMTPDDLRRQMLSVVFGWEADIRDLIRDELSRHPPQSQISAFLAVWLDDDPEYLSSLMGATGVLSTSDWMLLALGTLDRNAASKKITQVFLEKVLSKGDIHAAAALLLALGDKTDAIEIYVSRNLYLEAVLLTSLVTPGDWQRQSHLVRRWGEHVVENSEQQLAIRCFSCTGLEPTDPWTSPTAPLAVGTQPQTIVSVTHGPRSQQSHKLQEQEQLPEIYLKTLERRRTVDAPTPVAMPAPPTPFRAAHKDGTRITPQTSALKLITSFQGQKNLDYKFPGLKSDDRTPTHAASVTPIAESAIDRSALSPGGTGSYRLNNIRSLNSALAGRTPSSIHRHRLPSIGETPIETEPPPNTKLTNPQLPTPADSGSDPEKERAAQTAKDHEKTPKEQPTLTLSSARYEPGTTPGRRGQTPQTAVGPATAQKLPFQAHVQHASEDSLENIGEDGRSRTGSKSRKPDGLSIQMISVTELENEVAAGAKRPATGGSYQTTYIDTNSELTSPPQSGDLYRSSTKSPSVSGRSMDQYISSLEQAQYYSSHARSKGQSTSSKLSADKKSRRHQPTVSDEIRGRDDRRTIPSAKRSPSSPVSMSPEDLRRYTESVESIDSTLASTSGASAPEGYGHLERTPKLSRRRSQSGKEKKHGHRSRSINREGKSKHSSRGGSRHASPDPSQGSHRARGRSASRKEGSGRRSPSSPLPMVPSEEDRQQGSDPAMRFVSADRVRNQRSSSRKPSRETSAHRERSQERTRHGQRSRSRQTDEREVPSRKSSVSLRGESSKHRRHRDTSRAHSDKQEFMYDSQQSQSMSSLPLDGEFRSSSNPQTLLDRKKRELDAAAQLEARRLSLARRPSAPNIPLPGQHLHGKSNSDSYAPAPLQRSTTEDTLDNRAYGGIRTRRPSTPRAMQVTSSTRLEYEDALPNGNLPASTYQTPELHATLSPRPGSSRTDPEPRTKEQIEELLAQLPRHPAYDTRLNTSRGNSRTRDGRDASTSRGVSRDRTRISPGEAPSMVIGSTDGSGAVDAGPRVLPELAHLMSPPPPPPPPPAPPKDSRPSLSLRTDSISAASVPLPLSSIPNTLDTPLSANPNSNHRRGRSGQEVNTSQIISKIRGFTGRMRSTSRGRDNMSKSPPQGIAEDGTVPMMPYETNVNGVRREVGTISSVI